jgi:putative membrane fusion protein
LKKAVLWRKGQVLLLLGVFSLVLGYLLLLGFRGVYRFCLVHAIQTTCAETGEICVTHEGKGIILRNEVLVRAPGPGTVTRHISEKTKVPAHTPVASLHTLPDLSGKPRTHTLTAPIAGAVWYRWDGWEEVLVPGNWERLNFESLFPQVESSEEKPTSLTVKRGDVVFKIVDDLVNPYVVIKFKNEGDFSVKEGQQVDLEWEQGEGKGRVLRSWKKEDFCFIVVEVTQGIFDLPPQRSFHLKMVSQKFEGVVIPATAICQKKGTKGVYVSSLTGYQFKKIEVTGKAGNKAVVTGIAPGDEVVVNPWLLKKIEEL